MTLSTWLAFFVASWLISLSPGAGAISCMSAGMRYGFRQALWNLLGLQFGIVWMVAVVGVGLGAVMATSPLAFPIIKWLGVAYLIWLGIAQWHAPAKAMQIEEQTARSARQLLLRGFLVNISNPKGVVFMLAVLPQFIDQHAPLWMQYVICTITLCATDVVVMGGYTLLAVRVLSLLREPAHIRQVNRLFGTLFVAAGVLLAGFRHAA